MTSFKAFWTKSHVKKFQKKIIWQEKFTLKYYGKKYSTKKIMEKNYKAKIKEFH